MSFDVCIITPFHTVEFDVGGKFETYWKSSTAPLNSNATSSTRQAPSRLGFAGGSSSVHASPALQVAGPSSVGGGTVMVSSLTGEFAHLVIQVTRDLVPVVYAQRCLPLNGFDLHVGAVTYSQFKGLAQKSTVEDYSSATPSEWQHILSSGFHSLEYALKVR